jgi:hypothetical protein
MLYVSSGEIGVLIGVTVVQAAVFIYHVSLKFSIFVGLLHLGTGTMTHKYGIMYANNSKKWSSLNSSAIAGPCRRVGPKSTCQPAIQASKDEAIVTRALERAKKSYYDVSGRQVEGH